MHINFLSFFLHLTEIPVVDQQCKLVSTFNWFTVVDSEAIKLQHLGWIGLAFSIAAHCKRVLGYLHTGNTGFDVRRGRKLTVNNLRVTHKNFMKFMQ